MHYNQDGPNVYARNVFRLKPDVAGQCNIDGDSGGPVYKRNANGTLTAYGIIGGRIDLIGTCSMVLTDIRDAWYALPGTVYYP